MDKRLLRGLQPGRRRLLAGVRVKVLGSSTATGTRVDASHKCTGLYMQKLPGKVTRTRRDPSLYKTSLNPS